MRSTAAPAAEPTASSGSASGFWPGTSGSEAHSAAPPLLVSATNVTTRAGRAGGREQRGPLTASRELYSGSLSRASAAGSDPFGAVVEGREFARSVFPAEAESVVVKRRRLLASVASASVLAVSGCTGDASGSGDDDTTTAPATIRDTTTASDGTSSDRDLREANVTGVVATDTDDGARFDVTLFHNDDGEDGYANWWQVERLDGTRLGRRDLAHAHGTQTFTRSTTVEVPSDVDCVVVRGHDQTHGYGGQAMTVIVSGDSTRAIQQGSDPETFDSADCP